MSGWRNLPLVTISNEPANDVGALASSQALWETLKNHLESLGSALMEASKAVKMNRAWTGSQETNDHVEEPDVFLALTESLQKVIESNKSLLVGYDETQLLSSPQDRIIQQLLLRSIILHHLHVVDEPMEMMRTLVTPTAGRYIPFVKEVQDCRDRIQDVVLPNILKALAAIQQAYRDLERHPILLRPVTLSSLLQQPSLSTLAVVPSGSPSPTGCKVGTGGSCGTAYDNPQATLTIPELTESFRQFTEELDKFRKGILASYEKRFGPTARETFELSLSGDLDGNSCWSVQPVSTCANI